MSTPPVPTELPYGPGPVTYMIQAPEKKPSGLWVFLRRMLFGLLFVFLLFNIWLFLILSATVTSTALEERHYSGSESATEKIAVIRIDGVLLEGFIDYASRQIRTAALDEEVKAVVLVINSPGGTVTASDRIYRQITDLKEGKWPQQKAGKPVVVQMTSIAASGGYYIAAPAKTIFAEPMTITGSIGVYASFFNVHKLATDHGVEFKLFAKGELKGGGSPFHPMTPEQAHHWDELLEHNYQEFQKIVTEGRGAKLKHKPREEIKVIDSQGKPYIRRIADGGVFTAEEALKFGLVDKIGRLPDAIAEAETLAGVQNARVITYTRPQSWSEMLLGIQSSPPPGNVQLDQVPGMTRQMWFLTPGYELSGVQLPVGQMLQRRQEP